MTLHCCPLSLLSLKIALFRAGWRLQQSMPHKEYCIEVPSLYEGHVVNNNSRWAFVAEPSTFCLPLLSRLGRSWC